MAPRGSLVKIHDVSLGIAEDMLVWPGDPSVEVLPRLQISKGDAANVSELRIGTHTGTHVDPPIHFIEGGPGIDQVSLDVLFGPATVADLRGHPGPLGRSDFEHLNLSPIVTRLLLKTDNSDQWTMPRPIEFENDYTCLSVEAAEWLIERGIQLIGVDYLSVEQKGAAGHPVHVKLLSNGVVIVEGLDLSAIDPGVYTLVCLPLKILDGDGGPARGLLIEETMI
jgi:arylformamidase